MTTEKMLDTKKDRNKFRRCRRRMPPPTNTNRVWMISFSDLLTLLLAFFILRVAMSSLEKISLKDLNSRVGESLTESSVDENKLTESLTEKLKRVIEEPELHSRAKTDVDTSSQVLDITDSELGSLLVLPGATFEPASDELSEEAVRTLRKISRLLKDSTLEIVIEGHTDSTAISTRRFPSNWELSTSRAIAVARILIDEGISGENISVVGYADTKPLDDNLSEVGRTRNRRVEVFFRTLENISSISPIK